MHRFTIVVAFLILITYISNATIIRVPSNFNTIQLAIDGASGGDTIIINKGVYNENIDLKGKNLVIASLFLFTQDTTTISQTIIDGQQNGTVIKIINSESNLTQICGLSIRNGKSDNGGGILIDKGSKPIISYCNIYNNVAGSGGGIAIRSTGKPIIRNCKIFNNSTNGAYYSDSNGGGVLAGNYSEVRLISCELFNNSSGCSGGGIYAISNPLENLYRFSLSIERCVIYGNRASQGGGVTSIYGCDIKIVNSTIVDNHAASGSDLYLYDGNSTIINSIVYNSNYTSENSIHFEKLSCCTMSSSCQLNIHYSSIFGGLNSIKKVGNNAMLTYNENIIENDPLFVDIVKKDYRLRDSSPCINKGVSFFLIQEDGIFMGDTLVDYNPTDYYSDAPDIGAWEFLNALSVSTYELNKLEVKLNPDNGYMSVKSPNRMISRFELYDIAGRIVESDKIGRDNFELNISTLKRGWYLIKIDVMDTVLVKKIFKK